MASSSQQLHAARVRYSMTRVAVDDSPQGGGTLSLEQQILKSLKLPIHLTNCYYQGPNEQNNMASSSEQLHAARVRYSMMLVAVDDSLRAFERRIEVIEVWRAGASLTFIILTSIF